MSSKFKIFALLTIVVITILLILSMSSQIRLYNRLVSDKAVVESEISILENEIIVLESELELIGTEEYIEKMARERLGYIKPNEFIFRERQ